VFLSQKLAKLKKKGVCHTVALPFILKISEDKKENYRNSNISPCQKYNLQNSPLKETKILQYIIITL